jgi:pimeloyl-ACP methyl ester carboxylesterase
MVTAMQDHEETRSGPVLPPSQMIELPGSAPVWIYEMDGPPGAPVLMLLHGLGASAALNWFPVFDPLSAHFRVIAPDLRGHGRTPPGPEPFTLEKAADDAFAVADALGVDHFIAVGYSMGGPIAQLMWRQQRNRIAGLVLAATSRDFGGRIRDRLAFQSLPLATAATRLPGSDAVRKLVLTFLAPRFGSVAMRQWATDELRRGDSRRILEAAADLGRFSSREWISDVDVPTSVIVAMNDELVPTRRQLKLARAIPHSIAAFVNGDHYSVGSEPEDFARVLLHECFSVARRALMVSDPLSYWELPES